MNDPVDFDDNVGTTAPSGISDNLHPELPEIVVQAAETQENNDDHYEHDRTGQYNTNHGTILASNIISDQKINLENNCFRGEASKTENNGTSSDTKIAEKNYFKGKATNTENNASDETRKAENNEKDREVKAVLTNDSQGRDSANDENRSENLETDGMEKSQEDSKNISLEVTFLQKDQKEEGSQTNVDVHVEFAQVEGNGLKNLKAKMKNINWPVSLETTENGKVADSELNGDKATVDLGERKAGHKKGEEKLTVYKRRWYILALYSLYAFTQATVWNTFGPISASSKQVFGWSDGDIFLISNWGPIAYIISGILFSWMLDVKGLRWSCMTSAFLVAVGTALRCITMETPQATWLINVGHLLNGLGGPVAMGGPPIVSAVWFPTEERATATAIGTASGFMGVAISFVLGPYLVDDIPAPEETYMNATQSSVVQTRSTLFGDEVTSPVLTGFASTSGNASDITKRRDGIRLYMIIEAAWCAALFLLMLIYFPAKPPTPPCTSAGIQRNNFLKGLKNLLRGQQFWLVAAIYGSSLGVLFGWTSVISIDLSSYGIDEKEAGWIGFYSILSAGFVSLVAGRFADVFARAMKWYVFFLYAIGTVNFLLFALACVDVVTPSDALFYATIIVGSTAVSSTVPLIFELACELAYPTGEGTTNVVLTVINNVTGVVFLFTGMIPNIGTLWMNWTLLGTTAVCLPLLLLMKERFNRRDVDESYPNVSDFNKEVIVEAGPLSVSS